MNILGDSIAILLQHAEMAVAEQADLFEQSELHLHARLLQVFGCTLIVGGVNAGLPGEEQDGGFGNVHQFARARG